MSIPPSNDSNPIDRDFVILPSSIFEKKNWKDKEEEEEKICKIANEIFEQMSKPSDSKKADLRSYIITKSAGNPTIAYLALVSLNEFEIVSPEDRSMIQEMATEFCNILCEMSSSRIKSNLDNLSPKEISLKEGELPKVPQEHRAAITKYLRGEGSVIGIKKLIADHSPSVILRSIKILDLETDRLSPIEKSSLNYVRSTYELRTLCIQASGGNMNSYEAYTKSIDPKYFINQFAPISREYAAHEYNYIPERIKDHARISTVYSVDMMALSKRLALPSRVFYCIGGNCGVGKSRCAKTDEAFSKGLVDDEIVGALSLDTLKGKLRKGVDGITNQQVHAEGWVLAQKLSRELQNKAIKASIVVDERLGTLNAIKQIADVAESSGAKLRYKDIDGSLLVSCLRVIGRDIKTEPCMPYGPIASGQKILREERVKVIEMAIQNSAFESYQLFVADESGNQILAAEKKEGSFVVYNKALFDKSLEPISEKEIQRLKTEVISEEFIKKVEELRGINTSILERYKGMTIEEALEAHSKELPLYE